jgi:hypothetical protein
MDLAKAKDQGKKWLIRIAVGGVVTLAASAALYVAFTLNFAYSKGERVGFVQKLSKRGWVCKTNEGELAMVNMAGQQATIFLFTVPDDKSPGRSSLSRDTGSRSNTRSTEGSRRAASARPRTS